MSGLISPRMSELLRQTARTLRDGGVPLQHDFLVEHEVTFDEVHALAEWLAVGVDVLHELDRNAPGQRVIGMAIAGNALREASREERGGPG